jgi:hypothetical protein
MRFLVLMAASIKIRVLWDVAPYSLVGADQRFRDAIIAAIIEAICTSETSVYSETTWLYIPEGSNIHDLSCSNNMT